MKNNKLDLGNNRTLVKGRDGWFVANPKDKFVGGALITYGEFSHNEMSLFEELVDKNTNVFEVGANIGAHTVGLAKRAKFVEAFEPQPQMFQNLTANIFLNNLQNVILHNVGLGSRDGLMYVPFTDYDAEGNFGGISLVDNFDSAVTAAVEIKTLDQYRPATYKTFLKIDVEGMEEDVLKGGTKFIGAMKPVIYIENDRPDKSASLMSCLRSLGYDLYWDCPYLFNAKNHFGKSENKYPGIVSINMVCFPAGTKPSHINLESVVTDVHPIFLRK